jgi:ParB family transcriptional regulator, chromosome partitioning protein
VIEQIEIGKLFPHPDNPRKDLGDLTELAASIKANGVLQNLTVIPIEGGYRVIIGHRRLAAAKLAGLEELPCTICDMTPQQQVSTMLVENVQRSDLTIYEQACGFQMMLDFGDSVEALAQETGFSESTIRRRVKLLELDNKELKKAIERGASLTDFAKLEEILDPARKKSVLKTIGTNNFANALQSALDAQLRAEEEAKILEWLESFAAKVDKNNGYVRVAGYSYYNKQHETPADADKVRYYYLNEGTGNYGYFVLLRERTPEDGAPKAGMDEVNKVREARRRELLEITKKAYVLRRDFVIGYNGKKTPLESMRVVLRLACEYSGFGEIDLIEFSSMLGIEGTLNDNGDWDPEEVMAAVMEKFKGNAARVYFIFAYCACGDNKNAGYVHQWREEHVSNEALDMLYDLLISEGYQMSDEEKALQNGTHELFQGGTT